MLPRWFKNGTLLPTTEKTNKQIKTFSHYRAWSYVFYVLKKIQKNKNASAASPSSQKDPHIPGKDGTLGLAIESTAKR